jgi:4-amino-4-deoxy-L-arabinose transferase-like glycosyltransferase
VLTSARDPVEFVFVAGDAASDHSRAQTWTYGALLAITLLGAWLRIESLHAAPLWLDERAMNEVVRDSPSAWSLLSIGQTHNYEHPPLYYLLAYATIHAFSHPLAIRWPAALAGVLGIVATWALGRRVFGAPTALVAALLVAVASYHIAYSQDARFYSLICLTSSLAWLALLRFMERGTWVDCAGLAGSATLAVYTHRVTWPLVGCVFAYGAGAIWLQRDLQERRRVLFEWLSVAGLATFFLCLPELLNTVEYTRAHADQSQHSLHLSFAFVVALVRRWGSGLPHFMTYVFLALLAVGTVYALASRGARALFLVAWLVSTPLFFAVVPFAKFFDIRFMIASYPAFFLLVAGGIEALGEWRRRSSPSGELLATAVVTAVVASYLYKDTILRRLPLRCSEFYKAASILDAEDGFCRNEMLLNSLLPEHAFLVRPRDGTP